MTTPTSSYRRRYVGARPALVARSAGGSTRIRPGDVVEFTDADLAGLDPVLWEDPAGPRPPVVAFGVVLDGLDRDQLVALAADHHVDHAPKAKADTIRKRLVEADQKEA